MSAQCRLRFCGLVAFAAFFATQSFAASDLYLRDTGSDTGVEPYAGPGPVYLSPDIWVRNDADPNWEPYPFSTAAPPWTPLPHQNPEYRDSKTGQPNYVYVRIQNRGDQPSAGTERLRLYQAKASTGLAWPASWVDNVAPACGDDRLVGIEVTKPRRNAKSVTPAEREAYRDALLAIQTDPSLRYSDGVQYWRKQNDVHAGAGNPQHGNPAFLAWHREMMNRYEERLREADPLVTLLYWDWTEDPRTGTNLFTTDFMGASNATVAAPLVPLRPPTLRRNVGGTLTDGIGNLVCDGSLFGTDASFNAIGDFQPLAEEIETAPNHDCAHGYIGGYFAGFGQISSLSTAAQDPFFFMLHANVDRLWANWQRQNGDPTWLDPVATYGADSSNLEINGTMSPWDGATGMSPWTGPAAFGKTSKHRSVVYPPIYDTAPLNIPVLQSGESVVVEIPWYPPNVSNFNCAGDAGHFCLLARIETDISAPFGMSFAEGLSVGTNTRNNNNIAWKNVTIVDNVLEPAALRLISGTMVRNIFDREAIFQIALLDRTQERRFLLPELARVSLALPDEILERIRDRDARLQDLELVRDDVDGRALLQLVGKEPRFSVPLKADEAFTAELVVALPDESIPRELLAEPFHFDLEQRVDLPAAFFDPQRDATEVGGVRFTLDFAEILRSRREAVVDVQVADLQMSLNPIGRQVLSTGAGDRGAAEIQHLSVGEPLSIEVTQDPGDTPMRVLSLELDGEEAVSAERVGTLSETFQFDTPGVHTIVTRGINEDGEVVVRRTRVLVSESIPPNAVITSPAPGTQVAVGQDVAITAEAAAAYQRQVEKVSLYVKEGDEIATGLNLVMSTNYAPVATAEGPGPHTFSFTPERPGPYMFQVGAVDDAGVTGVSGHVMIMVTQ